METLTHVFLGRQIEAEAYHALVSIAVRGICPFCRRDGLRDNYGSKRKHLRACANRHNWYTANWATSDILKFLNEGTL